MTMTERCTQQNRTDPDLAVIQRMAAGDTSALDELYRRRGPGVLSYLAARLGDRQLAEEVLQDVMLAAWRGAAAFRGESSVRTWLLAIARNRAINTGRRYRPALVSLDTVHELQGDDTGLHEKVERFDRCAATRAALRDLPVGQRDVLVLFFYHQLTERDIAAKLHVAVGTVKSRLHRGKAGLRTLLQNQHGQ